ncbi:MAG: hypothetical protein HOI66_12845 [Verrucomicrobia bacterium]|jgi:hypothetical protein|nr:hypothetical protein [Verrucomicrobiota bacterium]MDA7510083.1 hypothetical protein [Verrucomicrobiota bacterium]
MAALVVKDRSPILATGRTHEAQRRKVLLPSKVQSIGSFSKNVEELIT